MRGVPTAANSRLSLTPRGQRYADLMRLDSEALEAMGNTYLHIGLLDSSWRRPVDRRELISALVAAEERGAG